MAENSNALVTTKGRARDHAQLVKTAIRWIKTLYPVLTHEMIQDLTQDAWIHVLKRKDAKNLPPSLRSYVKSRAGFYLPRALSIEGNNWGYAIDSIDPYRIMEWREDRLELEDELEERLSPRERDVTRLKFGITVGCASRKLEEVGQRFNVSRERIRQILDKSIRKLKKSSRLIDCQLLLKEEYDFPIRLHVSNIFFVDIEWLIELGALSEESLPQYVRNKLEKERQWRKARQAEIKEEKRREIRERNAEAEMRRQSLAQRELISQVMKKEKEVYLLDLSEALRELVGVSVLANGHCPGYVIQLFLESVPNITSKEGEGFYLVIDKDSNSTYAIANYGWYLENPCLYELKLEVWSRPLIPNHIRNLIFAPGYSRKVILPLRSITFVGL